MFPTYSGTQPLLKPQPLIALGASVAVMASATGADGQPVEWVRLLPMGVFGGRDGRGPYKLNGPDHAAQVIAATMSHAGGVDPVFDYDHQSEYAPKPGVGGKAPASGWMKEFDAREDGIYARVEWTAAAHAALAAKEYRYISPVFVHAKDGTVRGILRAGLTNNPNLTLPAVASQADLTDFNPADEGLSMSLTAIAAALGLGAAASEADCLGAITTLQGQATGLATVAQAAGLQADAAAGDVVTAISAFKADGKPDLTKWVPAETVVAIQSQLTELQGSISKDKAEAAVDAAIRAGKVVPALRDHFIAVASADPAQFAEFEAKAPVVVAPGLKPPGKIEDETVTLTAEDRQVMSQMDISEEDFLAAKKGGL
jgi:phage I-like protein